MLIIDNSYFVFNSKEVHFSDYPFDIEGCDSVTFLFCNNKVNAKGFTCQEKFTSTIDLTPDLDIVWKKMDRKSTRYSIKRAQKDGVKARINEGYDQFYQIYKSFIRKKGINPLLGVGTTNLKTMKKYGTLFVAEHDGELLGGHLYLENEFNIKLWLSASKRLEVDREKARLIGNANRLLHWEAMKYAKEKAIREFDWGGLWSEEEAEKDEKKKAINSFKLSFGGEVVVRYFYQKVYSKAYRFAQYIYTLASHGIRKG